MDFALDDNSDTIPLIKELEQVENIIGLNQLRFDHKLHILLITNLENNDVTIIPLVLLTLVENIFKHGNLNEDQHPAIIKIESTAASLQITTSNLVGEKPLSKSHNSGMANISSRLERFYQDKYQFSYQKEDRTYLVNLRIDF